MATALVGMICSATQWQQAARSLHQKAHPSDLQDARAPGLLAGPRFCPGRAPTHSVALAALDLRTGRSARARRLPRPTLGRQRVVAGLAPAPA